MQEKLYILPAEQPEQAYKSNLPVQLTPLIDREQEVSVVCALLSRPNVRLLTLTGPPGIGKTRLALQVATEFIQDFTDGVFFVPLAPISDPAFVALTIAQIFDLREAGSQPIPDLLQVYLQHRHLLLLLDNFEQVLPAASLLASLLVACPGLKMLVTSREVLRLRGEQQYPVPPLEVPDPRHSSDIKTLVQHAAVALFLQRAQAIKSNFALTPANAQAITEICRRLDGLPLAIELAAAHIKVLSPQSLLARLEHRLQVLTRGPQDLPERQQTLRSTLTWSYDLLGTQEQRLFRRLSIFVGGCTLQAVEAVWTALGDEAESVLDRVTSLVDKSLLQQTAQGDEEPRLTMLETIREYGLERLVASGEMDITWHAHAAYYLALAEKVELEFDSPQQAVLERLEQEHDNLRAALQWSLEQEKTEQNIEERQEMALRLGGALRGFWRVRGYWSEGLTFLQRALAGSERVAAPVRAKAFSAAANLALRLGDVDRGEALCKESLALYRKLEDKGGIALALYLLGDFAWRRGNLAETRSLKEESYALSKQVGNEHDIAWALFDLSELANQQGEYARARALCEESLAIHRQQGDKMGTAWSLYHLARILFVSQGDPAAACSLLEESLVLSREVGDIYALATSLWLLGRMLLQQGDAEGAGVSARESTKLYREMGDQQGRSEALSLLARVASVQGDCATARALYEQSLAIVKKRTYKCDIALYLEGLAGVVAVQGDSAWAARLWGMAEALREAIGAPLPPVYRAEYEQAVAAAHLQLGEQAFAAAWGEGRTMTPEQALAAQRRAPTPVEQPTAHQVKAAIPSYPAGLSAREVEILRLVAQGLTDAQVAHQLVLSRYTVSTHLHSIYTKLGVTSRTAATRFAVEQHLV